VAVNFLAGPRALVRERDHQERREHTLNGYGLIQIKSEANARDEARRIAANVAKLPELLGAPRSAPIGRANCREFNVASVWGSVLQLEQVSCLSQWCSRSAGDLDANTDLSRNTRRYR